MMNTLLHVLMASDSGIIIIIPGCTMEVVRCPTNISGLKDAPINQDCAGQVSFLNSYSCWNNCFLKGFDTTFMSRDGHLTLCHCYQIDQRRLRIFLYVSCVHYMQYGQEMGQKFLQVPLTLC